MRKTVVLLAALVLAVPALAALKPERKGQILKPEQYLDFTGIYHLKDGRLLKVYRSGNRVLADLNGAGWVEVHAQAPLVFASGDGKLKLEFTVLPFATEVLVTHS
jgi:hypothetical protein